MNKLLNRVVSSFEIKIIQEHIRYYLRTKFATMV